jgi:hypothetical protein
MTHTYGNICGIDSNKVKFHYLTEDLKVYLLEFPHIEINHEAKDMSTINSES